MCDFSDLQLVTLSGGSDENDCPWAKHITEYLEAYINNHIYDGKLLRDRFYFNATLIMVKKENNAWVVQFNQMHPAKAIPFPQTHGSNRSNIYSQLAHYYGPRRIPSTDSP